MNFDQAQEILGKFSDHPSLRADQEDLYKLVYNGSLRGKPISQVPDKQLRGITHSLYDKALALEREELDFIALQEAEEQFEQGTRNRVARLFHTLQGGVGEYRICGQTDAQLSLY